MPCIESPRLTADEIEAVLRQPNGPYALMELVRMGRVDSETATAALDQFEKDPFLTRVLMALVDAFLARP